MFKLTGSSCIIVKGANCILIPFTGIYDSSKIVFIKIIKMVSYVRGSIADSSDSSRPLAVSVEESPPLKW